MTPAARVQAAIELLDRIVAAARAGGAPADRILADWAKGNRYAGSGDRREVRELVYRAIRACGPVPLTGRSAMLHLAEEDPSLLLLFDGSVHGPDPIKEGELVAEGGIAPAWLVERLADSEIEGAEAAALLDRAPLDIRVNTLKALRDELELPEAGEKLALRDALRLPAGTPVESWSQYREGLIEVQDLGSQIVSLAVAARPGETVIDLCAGAGGKTLALAAAMENRGLLIAADTDRPRLARLAPRAARAGADMIATALLNPGREAEVLKRWEGEADAVLVDAPCSGTGTWRRNPENRWRLGEVRLERLLGVQEHLLGVATRLARPGGRVIYAVCSVLDAEGPDQIEAFVADHPSWRAQALALPLGRTRGPGWRLTPHRDGTDGFFIAQLIKPC